MDIDGCRVPSGDASFYRPVSYSGENEGWDRPWKHDDGALSARQERMNCSADKAQQIGRWPANLIHDGSEEVLELFPQQKSPAPYARSTDDPTEYRGLTGTIRKQGDIVPGYGDSGSAARFFYCAKASRKEREAGLEGMPIDSKEFRWNKAGEWTNDTTKARNHHPTVKPIALMEYLIRLVSRPGQTILDPFMGSGTTGIAAANTGREFIGIEKEAEYVEIAQRRIYGPMYQEAQT